LVLVTAVTVNLTFGVVSILPKLERQFWQQFQLQKCGLGRPVVSLDCDVIYSL